MGKGEIARYEQFLLFPQCFQKACFPGASNGVIVWEWLKEEGLPQKHKIRGIYRSQDISILMILWFCFIQFPSEKIGIKTNLLSRIWQFVLQYIAVLVKS